MSENSQRKKIILTDDTAFFLVTAKSRLEKLYEVYTAQSAAVLYEILENVVPDLIVLDINLPDENGFDIVAKLKADIRTSIVPVVFLSGNANKKNMLKAAHLGAIDFLSKPYNDVQLLECIDSLVNDKAVKDADKPIVLAVDDTPSVLTDINHILNGTYRVYTLPDSKKLKSLLDMVTPDLFILDYQMPGMSGFDLVPVIRDHKMHGSTPILFLTTEGTTDHVATALSLGANDFMIKPLNATTLRHKVALHLKHYRIQRRILALPKNR